MFSYAIVSSGFFALPDNCPHVIFNESDFKEAIDIIKATEPVWYEYFSKNYTLEAYGNQSAENGGNMAGFTWGRDKVIHVNMNSTAAFRQFSGTVAQFLAATIIHEAHHVGFYEDRQLNRPSANDAMNEASARYWTEDWAIRHNMPVILVGTRTSGSSTAPVEPDWRAIYDTALRDGSTETPYRQEQK